MNVDRERPDIAEAVPDGAADSQVDRLQLYGQPQSVKIVALGDVGIGCAQPAGDFLLVSDQVALQPGNMRTELVGEDARERV